VPWRDRTNLALFKEKRFLMFFETLLMRPGDRVVATCHSETDSMGVPGFANKEGMIAGFGERSFGRTRCFGVKPGVYRDLSSPQIVFDADKKKKRYRIPSHFVRLLDPAREALRDRSAHLLPDSAWRARVEKNFLRDLPETPFWEGDLVLVPTGGFRMVHRTIAIIDHDALATSRYPSSEKAFGVAEHIADSPEHWCSANELSLVQRGNVHRRHRGELLVFPTGDELVEEAALAITVGAYDMILPPKKYREQGMWWVKSAMIEGLRTGMIDWMLVERSSGELAVPSPVHHRRRFGVKFLDPELGVRLAMRALRSLEHR